MGGVGDRWQRTTTVAKWGGDDKNEGCEGGNISDGIDSKGEMVVAKGRMHIGHCQGQGQRDSRGDKNKQEWALIYNGNKYSKSLHTTNQFAM